MIVAVVLVGLVITVLVVVRRAAKRRLVAGLVASRPAYTIEPPGHRVGSRKREAL